MTKDRRWLKSVIAASKDVAVALPWARPARRRPATLLIPVQVRVQHGARIAR